MILTKSKIFLYSLIFFIFGVALASFLPSYIVQKDICLFSGLVFGLALVILFWRFQKLRLIFFLLAFLFLGLWRYSISLPVDSPDEVWHYNNQNVELSGRVCNEPDVRQNNQKLEICVESIERPNLQLGGSASIGISGKVLVTTNIYPFYDYGDYLKINCDLKKPEKFNDFSYDKYLARYNIYSVCYYPRLLRETRQTPSWKAFVYGKIFYFKHLLRDKINFNISEPEASLANAIFLGYKKNLPAELQDNFSKIGISHISAISGMHISIISIILMSFLLSIGLNRKKAFYFSTIILITYIIIIGLPASAMRAGLMGFLVLWSLSLGRLNKITNSLFFAAVILLMINPKLLHDDIGFQLSFLAVLGIVYFYPIINNFFEIFLERLFKSRKIFNILKIVFNIFSLTLSAQILTLPIIAYNFSSVSLISPLSNLLIVWILPFLLVGIILALILSFVIPVFNILFFFPIFLMLKYIICLSIFLIKLPYAYLEIIYFSSWWIVLYYLVILLIFWKINIKKSD